MGTGTTLLCEPPFSWLFLVREPGAQSRLDPGNFQVVFFFYPAAVVFYPAACEVLWRGWWNVYSSRLACLARACRCRVLRVLGRCFPFVLLVETLAFCGTPLLFRRGCI